MIVFQLSRDGYLIGPVAADRDPMLADNFLIPAGCIKKPPPAFDPSTHRARWSGQEWTVEAIPAPEPELELQPPPIVQPPAEPFDPRAYAGVLRRQIEEQGVVLPSGVVVKSDVESQGKIAQTIQAIDLGMIEEPINWKAASGFVQLTRDDLIAAGTAAARHVQRAFDAELVVLQAIEAGTVATAPAIEEAFALALAPPDPV